jgi:NAD(P)-dependent dehydrogenase (short-subunit alcohol dehydrogenase family)
MRKFCIITGGTRGIGLGISQMLIKKNFNVISLSKTGKCCYLNENFFNYKCDVTDNIETTNIIGQILKTKKIDLVVHNSGITKDSFFHKMEFSDWNDVINTNLISCYNIIKQPLIQMRENNYGNIILISSVNAHIGQIGQTNYSSSKAGIIGFAKSLALENSNKNIRVNVISPGYIKTEMTEKIPEKIQENIKKKIPLQNFGTIDNVSSTVNFILENNYINGCNISVNGGLFMN